MRLLTSLVLEKLGFKSSILQKKRMLLFWERSNRFDASIFGKTSPPCLDKIWWEAVPRLKVEKNWEFLQDLAAEKLKAVVTTKAWWKRSWSGSIDQRIREERPLLLQLRKLPDWKVPEHFKTLMMCSERLLYCRLVATPATFLANKVMAISGGWWDNPLFVYAGIQPTVNTLSTSSAG